MRLNKNQINLTQNADLFKETLLQAFDLIVEMANESVRYYHIARIPLLHKRKATHHHSIAHTLKREK